MLEPDTVFAATPNGELRRSRYTPDPRDRVYTESLLSNPETFTNSKHTIPIALTSSIALGALRAARPARNGLHMNKNVIKIALLATALTAAPLTWGLVSAQTAPTSPAATATQAAVNYANVFIGKLATALGVTSDKLNAGISSASTQTIDEALKNQDITRTQADQLKLDVQNGRNPFLESRGFGKGRGDMDGGHGGMNGGRDGGGMGGFQIASLEAAAKALGMTATDLEAQFRAGQTLEQIATTKKTAVKTVQDAVIAALQTQLAAEVEAGRITQARADQIIAKAKANPNFGLRFGGGRGPRR